MYKYKHSLTKIETSYIVAFLSGTNCQFLTANAKNLDTILLFLSSFGPMPQNVHDFGYRK